MIVKRLFFVLCLSGCAGLLSWQAARAEEPLFRSLAQTRTGVVTRVISTGMIELENDEKVRLIGLKAPKPPKPEKPDVNEYGIIIRTEDPTKTVNERALEFARDLLEGREVRLEQDTKKIGEDFTTLAYVFLPDGTMANEEILRQGYADLSLDPLNRKYSERLRSAYGEAREEKRGLRGQ